MYDEVERDLPLNDHTSSKGFQNHRFWGMLKRHKSLYPGSSLRKKIAGLYFAAAIILLTFFLSLRWSVVAVNQPPR